MPVSLTSYYGKAYLHQLAKPAVPLLLCKRSIFKMTEKSIPGISGETEKEGPQLDESSLTAIIEGVSKNLKSQLEAAPPKDGGKYVSNLQPPST